MAMLTTPDTSTFLAQVALHRLRTLRKVANIDEESLELTESAGSLCDVVGNLHHRRLSAFVVVQEHEVGVQRASFLIVGRDFEQVADSSRAIARRLLSVGVQVAQTLLDVVVALLEVGGVFGDRIRREERGEVFVEVLR